MQGVHRLGEVLDFSNPSGWLNNLCRKESAKEEDTQIISGYREGHKECVQESLRILEFVENTKLRRDRDFN
jgi:hypothetical protein